MANTELSDKFLKLAERLQTVVDSLEEHMEENRQVKVASNHSMSAGSDLGRLSNLPGKSNNPLLDFILS
jgi:hypothetical protein